MVIVHHNVIILVSKEPFFVSWFPIQLNPQPLIFSEIDTTRRQHATCI
jgi:hypothetical protein